MPSSKPRFADSVFINCPFDKDYWPIFEAIIFSIVNCGFVPRCSLEIQDSGQTRYENIQNIIKSSKYSIHDISRVQLTPILVSLVSGSVLNFIPNEDSGSSTLKNKNVQVL